jgi:hypothetical protein
MFWTPLVGSCTTLSGVQNMFWTPLAGSCASGWQLMMMNIQIIQKDGKPEWAVIPYG